MYDSYSLHSGLYRKLRKTIIDLTFGCSDVLWFKINQKVHEV